MFDCHATIYGAQIINYRIYTGEKWLVLVGISGEFFAAFSFSVALIVLFRMWPWGDIPESKEEPILDAKSGTPTFVPCCPILSMLR